MSRIGSEIIEGLQEAVAFSRGKKTATRVSRVKVPSVNVARARKKTGLSQVAFSNLIGVSVGTLRNWEQGRRTPEGPAKVLIALVDKRPTIVIESLSNKT